MDVSIMGETVRRVGSPQRPRTRALRASEHRLWRTELVATAASCSTVSLYDHPWPPTTAAEDCSCPRNSAFSFCNNACTSSSRMMSCVRADISCMTRTC